MSTEASTPGSLTEATTVHLSDVRGTELAQAIRTAKFGVLAFGAVEDHGPLGTLGMDTYSCVYLAEQVARRLASCCPRLSTAISPRTHEIAWGRPRCGTRSSSGS